MKKSLVAVGVALSLTLGGIAPATADAGLVPQTENTSPSTSSESSPYFKAAAAIVGAATVAAMAAAGLNWAVQLRLIPNPLPGIIPNPPAPPKKAPAKKPAAKPAPAKQAAPKPAPKPAAPAPKPAQRTTAYYKNCTDVWNRLGRPIRSHEPGFHSRLDRDGDGIGCEKRPR